MAGIATNTIVQIQTLRDHNFEPGSKLSDVIALYYLDVDLRNILVKYLNRIEIYFRTKVIYYVSNRFKESPAWFADESIVNVNFIKSINKVYTLDFIKNNKTLKKHHDKYNGDTYAPAWKTLEFFTFGALLNLFKNLKDEDIKRRVSDSLGIHNIGKFENLMRSVVLIRNICSHGDVLYDFKTPRGLSVVPNINFEGSDRNSLNACLKVISYFLEQISPNRCEDFNNQLNEVFSRNMEIEGVRDIISGTINYK